MGAQAKIESHQDLRVWQESARLAKLCYELTKNFPRDELYGLTAQIRRAANSIPANIAEGHGRSSLRDYLRFLYIARGSLKELESHLVIAHNASLISIADTDTAAAQCTVVGRMLLGLIRSLQRKL